LQIQTLRIDPGKLQDLLGQADFLFGLDITIQVMAVADVSAGDEDAVSPVLEGVNDVDRVDPAAAHNPNRPEVLRILQPGDAGQISSGISAPVAEESQDLGFELSHMSLTMFIMKKVLQGIELLSPRQPRGHLRQRPRWPPRSEHRGS